MLRELGILEDKEKVVNKKAKLDDVVEFYYTTPKFKTLKSSTQNDYMYQLDHALNTWIGATRFGDMQIGKVNIKHVTEAYNKWLDAGVRTANARASSLSVVWRVALQHMITDSNPISLLDRKQNAVRKVRWTRNQVKTFLSTAYSNYKWRSAGLIVHMAYEWAQRVGDMRLLTWDCLDLDAQRIDMEQSKRHAEVHLPISDGLTQMLKLQRDDFGFQDYVAPRVKPQAGAYTPYQKVEVSILINDILEEANLPLELTAMDLRRTAITEMLEAGADLAGIMQVSGHNSPQSVKPYMVNTFSGASRVLEARNRDAD